MARIRTIKPDFWKNERLCALPEATHILAAALINYADDEGYFNANPDLIKGECLPTRKPSVTIPASLQKLQEIGYCRFGTAKDGRRYGHIINFSDHQRISHSKESLIRPLEILWEGSGNIPEASVKPPAVLRPEWNGMEGKQEGKGTEVADAPGLDSSVWQRWTEYRTAIKKPLKPVSIPAAQKELAAYGPLQAAVVEQSVANGWQGLFPLRKGPASTAAKPRAKTVEELEAEERTRAVG